MTRILISILGLLILACGCVSSAKNWHRNSEGYITSGIKVAETKVTQRGDTTTISFGDGKELRDPLEDLPEFRNQFAAANAYAHTVAEKYRGQLGAISMFWDAKKKFLRERYRIDWKSPEELNPHISYD